MKNESNLKYTYKHRKVVMYLANKYIKENKDAILCRMKNHDLDKMFMYLFYDKKDVSQIHRRLSSHHKNELEKDYIDYVEMVLDWESARYTKPDKPLNAYDTLYKYYPTMEEKIIPILEEFEINKSNLPMEEDVLEYANSISEVSNEEIKNELLNYINSECIQFILISIKYLTRKVCKTQYRFYEASDIGLKQICHKYIENKILKREHKNDIV